MPKKPKITVREIRKDIKVTEIKKEESQEESSDREEVPLEEIASSAPSSRLFPQFQQGQQPEFGPQELPPEPQAEQSQQAQAEQAGPRYAVRNVTEGELRRAYGVAESRGNAQQTSSRNPMLLEMRQSREDAFMNRSLVDKRSDEDEEEKYSRPADMKPKKETRHYPWEA